MAEAILRERGQRSIVASMKSHGRGRNGLQFAFHRQLITCPPSTNTDHEQLIGRLHRDGQQNDVETEVFAHTPELRNRLDSAKARARYVSATWGAPQKLSRL
jgi:hypothetical protein